MSGKTAQDGGPRATSWAEVVRLRTLPAAVADLPDSVAWVPECSTGSVIHDNLGGAGTVATLRATQEVAR